MLREVVSDDGALASGPEGLGISFRIADEISARDARSITNTDSELVKPELIGRSSIGQIGIEVQQTGPAETFTKRATGDKYLFVPISLEPHTQTGETLADDMSELAANTKKGERVIFEEKELGVGRFVNFGALDKLDNKAVQQAIDNKLIAIGSNGEAAYKVNDDGSVTVQISQLEFLFNPQRFKTPEQRLKILRLGRSALVPHSDVIYREPNDPLPDFLVGGVVFSPGPFYWSIREDVGKYSQLPSARFFDSNRLMGMSPARDAYDRNRQVELVKTRPRSSQTYAETSVTIDVYRDTDVTDNLRDINWFAIPLSGREKLHKDGVSALNIVRATDPLMRNKLKQTIHDPKNAALLLSRKGAIVVPAGQTYKFDVQNILDATEDWGDPGTDQPDETGLSLIVESLSTAGDRSNVVVARTLKPEDMLRIVNEADVRAFLIDEYNPDGPFLTKEEHSILAEMARRGVAIGWDGEIYRELHKSGLFMKPEASTQIEDLELVVAMYGGNRDIIGDNLRPQIGSFFDRLTRIVPRDKLGVAHGSGQGVMDAANNEALKRGILSLGVGIQVEQVGQETKSTADGIALFNIRDRLYRQQMLDTFNTISIYNAGGAGTLEEMFITVCTHKLLMCLPTPKITVDEDNLYASAEAMIEEISTRKTILIDGKAVDLTDNPFVDRWITSTFHRVNNYGEAATIIESFIKDPGKYWRECGISPAKIATALETHSERLAHVGMKLPSYLKSAAEQYIIEESAKESSS